MSKDPFLNLVRQGKPAPAAPTSAGHSERAHSKFSASGAERWFNCPGSVQLSEGLPDKASPWAEEGTQAHEVLEALMKCELSGNDGGDVHEAEEIMRGKPREMISHGANATEFITGLHYKTPDSECLVENRVYLKFIHPEMFGTYDGAVIEHFGTLHVFDYKYGAGHAVTPGPTKPGGEGNLQMIFYGIGVAHQFHWNFKRIKLWIIQPRIKGYDGPLFWELSIEELRRYVPKFKAAVDRVEANPDLYVEGSWCHWCKAKGICPLKTTKRTEQAIEIFKYNKLKTERTSDHGKKENEKEGREKSGKEKSRQKSDPKTDEEKELEAWYKKRQQKEKRSKAKTRASDETDFF